MSNYPSVAVVIIHWNKRELLEKYIPSVMQSTWPNLKVVLADNASEDDSVSWIRQNYPQVQIIQLDKNYGYAEGYFRALKQVSADYYVLLNNDVEVPQGWIEPVIAKMESDATVGAAQPKLLQHSNPEMFEYAGAAGGFMDKLGYVFCRGRIFENIEADNGQYETESEVFWASGACLFLRAQAYHQTGGLDIHFFAHMEEVDLCWRLKLAGYKVMYIPESHVYHLGGSTLQMGSPHKTYLNFRNSLIMALKNYPLTRLIWFIPVRSTLDLTSSIFFLIKGERKHSAAVHKAHADFFFRIGKWFALRKNVVRKVPYNQISGIYRHSVVYQHFIKKIKKYSDLPFN